MVIVSLLYGCEKRTLNLRHIEKLEMFNMIALRSIFGITLMDRITKLDIGNSISINAHQVRSLKSHS